MATSLHLLRAAFVPARYYHGLLGLLLVSCNLIPSIQSPKAAEGVLDLRHWNFEEQGNVALNGEWAFYWQQLLQAADFQTATPPSPDSLVGVPSVWNSMIPGQASLPRLGYATYRLTVKTSRKMPMALKIGTLSTAASIYVDHQKVYEAGRVGTSRQTSTPAYAADFVWFEPSQETFDLIVQVSNFHYWKGGFWNVMFLGQAKDIKEAWFRSAGLDFFLIGSILLISFYHLILYCFRKESKTALYFSLFCATVAIRIASTDTYLITHFINIPWNWLVRLEFVSFFLAVVLFVQFFASLFVGLFADAVLKIFWIIAISLTLIVFWTQPLVFSYTAIPYEIIGLLAAVYTLYLSVVARRKKLPGSLVFMIGYVILMATFVNDILYVNDIVITGYTFSVGLLCFIILQTFLLSKGFALAFIKLERLNKVMVNKNEQIKAQNVVLKQLNEELDIFVYRTSHDLRAPISSVLGLIQLIRMEPDSASREQYLSLQEKSLCKLDGFIQDILHYSRNTRLELELEEVNFHQIIEDVFSLYNYLDHYNRIERIVSVSQSAAFVSDTKRLTIILNNLVSNALRYYNTRQAQPFVSIQVAITPSEAHLTVSDNGQGIGEEHLEKIFDMFYRASHEAKGSGLGLFLVKETVHKLQGEVKVTSQVNRGTQFFIKIPNRLSRADPV